MSKRVASSEREREKERSHPTLASVVSTRPVRDHTNHLLSGSRASLTNHAHVHFAADITTITHIPDEVNHSRSLPVQSTSHLTPLLSLNHSENTSNQITSIQSLNDHSIDNACNEGQESKHNSKQVTDEQGKLGLDVLTSSGTPSINPHVTTESRQTIVEDKVVELLPPSSVGEMGAGIDNVTPLREECLTAALFSAPAPLVTTKPTVPRPLASKLSEQDIARLTCASCQPSRVFASRNQLYQHIRRGRHNSVGPQASSPATSSTSDIVEAFHVLHDTCNHADEPDAVHDDIDNSLRQPSHSTILHDGSVGQDTPGDYTLPTTKRTNVLTELYVGRDHVTTVLDTGAARSVMSEDLYRLLRRDLHLPLEPTNLVIRSAHGTLESPAGEVVIPIYFDGKKVAQRVIVSRSLPTNLLLGADCLDRLGAIINFPAKTVTFTKKDCTLTIRCVEHVSESLAPTYLYADASFTLNPGEAAAVKVTTTTLSPWQKQKSAYAFVHSNDYKSYTRKGVYVDKGLQEIQNGKTHIVVVNPGLTPTTITRGERLTSITPDHPDNYNIIEWDAAESTPVLSNTTAVDDVNAPKADLPEGLKLPTGILDDEQMEKFKELIRQHLDVFAENPKAPTPTHYGQHEIRTEDVPPIKQHAYRYSPQLQEVVNKEVDSMLEGNIVRPSSSSWSSPVVLAPKKDGTVRFCIDYRRLNSVTIKDVYPLPRIDDTLDRLGSGVYFSTMDLAAGFWQIPLREEDKPKTAFVTHRGLYEYNVMPFGLCNAPASFQRMMDIVLAGIKYTNCLVYLDDIIVYSPTFEQHLKDLAEVFDRLRKAGLSLKASKCTFFEKEVNYLGHRVSAQGIKPDVDKIRAILEYPVPKCKDELYSFLGLIGYYRRFIKFYSKHAAPLFALLKHDVMWTDSTWGEPQQRAFEWLRDQLSCDVVLAHPDFSNPFKVQTDAVTRLRRRRATSLIHLTHAHPC